MLQLFHVDVAYVASVSEACCKRLLKMFQVFLFDVAYVSHMLQEYAPMISAVSVLYCSKRFHVASVLSRCYICFTHMFQVYILNVSSASDVYYIQVFSCYKCLYFRGIFRESWGT
jgi:hypothetical protein